MASQQNKDEMTAQKSLLTWCLANLDGYNSVRVKDFSTSWRDGKAFIAILNRHRPDQISYNESHQRSNKENLKIAFNFAELELGVSNILDVDDIDIDSPDERSIIAYLSMLNNTIPNVPVHPDELVLESRRNSNLEEYSQICRSLMRWLKESISIMDNRNVPTDLSDIKMSLNDVKTFRLEEYCIRLKEKKKLVQLSNELMQYSEDEKTNIESELKSIEKVWQKFDNYIQLRENLLEKSLKKYENLQLVINKIDKLFELCDKRLNQIEKDFYEFIKSNKNQMNQHQIRLANERFDEQLRQCDQELRKMFIECQHLKDEEHSRADIYYEKLVI